MPLPPANHSLGIPFIELQSVDSTNNYALAQIHANLAQPGTCFFAHAQTAGKGQRGKSWVSEKGSNIVLSIVLNPFFLQPFEQFYLSSCVAVATQQFLKEYTHDDLKIKWPNDLYWKDQKIGGILIENIIGGIANDLPPATKTTRRRNWKWAIVGIGININQKEFPGYLNNPVSLKQITNQNFNTVQLAKGLCQTIDLFYKQLMNEGHDAILKLYNQVLYRKNEVVNLKKGSRNFQAKVKSVNASGQLIIQHSIEERIDFGEVEWIPVTTAAKQ